jgi:hypothetical protein
MNASPFISSGCQNVQAMADQTPAFDKKRKRKSGSSQVLSKAGIIRPDKRKKVRYI